MAGSDITTTLSPLASEAKPYVRLSFGEGQSMSSARQSPVGGKGVGLGDIMGVEEAASYAVLVGTSTE